MIKVGRIGFIGGGKIGQAMAKGFIAAGLTKADSITASCHPSDKINIEAFKSIGANSVTENKQVVGASDVVFISVKPTIVPTVLKDISSVAAGKLFISVAMGVTLKQIEQRLPAEARVIRVMPNTPALVRQGCSVFVRGANATNDDAIITSQLLRSIGTCDEVSESQMDVITGLSGSGPAYVFVMIEALADGAVKMGLPRDLAYKLASQTVMGSGKLVRDLAVHPGILKDDVTSPGGSTAAGLSYLEKYAFRSVVAGAVEAATLRCMKLSETQ